MKIIVYIHKYIYLDIYAYIEKKSSLGFFSPVIMKKKQDARSNLIIIANVILNE